jgi:hypothetical protein
MARGVGGESPANVMKHLGGIDFPADKQTILEQAKRGDGPDTQEVVEFLEKIPDREYGGPQEILKEYSNADQDKDDKDSSDSK